MDRVDGTMFKKMQQLAAGERIQWALAKPKKGIRQSATSFEAPGHGKWWLDGKTGSDKSYCQQCMCSIITPEAEDSGKQMLNAKWIDHGRGLVAVSPPTECVRILLHDGQFPPNSDL